MSNLGTEGGIALADFAQGTPCSDERWREDGDWDPVWSGFTKGGSANIDMIGNACWLIYGNHRQQEEMVESWLDFFDRNETEFQRTEQLSIIYSCIHVAVVLCVLKWAFIKDHKELQEKATRWLHFWWGLMSLSVGNLRGGRAYSVICGERSSGIPLENYYGHHSALGEALGMDWPDRGKAIHGPWDDKTNDWINRVYVGCSHFIKETAAPILLKELSTEDLIKVMPKFHFRTPVYFYSSNRGVICWWGWDTLEQDAAQNGNTGPIMVLKLEDGKLTSGPVEGGPHWRQKPMYAATKYNPETKEVSYALMGEGWQEEGVIPLPAGEPLRFVEISSDGIKDLLKPLAPPVEEPKPPVISPPKPKKPKKNLLETLLDAIFSILK